MENPSTWNEPTKAIAAAIATHMKDATPGLSLPRVIHDALHARGFIGLFGQGLTPRERQVLDILIVESSNAAIAKRMGISISTVKNHLAIAFQKLGVTSRRLQATIAWSKAKGANG